MGRHDQMKNTICIDEEYDLCEEHDIHYMKKMFCVKKMISIYEQYDLCEEHDLYI